MSAGTGVVHSEFNASEGDPVHSIQIWITPAAEDLPPSYQQIAFAPSEKRGRFRLLAGPQMSPTESMTVINQDARVYVSELRPRESLQREVVSGRKAWIQVVRGNVAVNGYNLNEGDGAGISDEQELSLVGAESEGCEVLLFDLP